jgi:hypothetical protein
MSLTVSVEGSAEGKVVVEVAMGREGRAGEVVVGFGRVWLAPISSKRVKSDGRTPGIGRRERKRKVRGRVRSGLEGKRNRKEGNRTIEVCISEDCDRFSI